MTTLHTHINERDRLAHIIADLGQPATVLVVVSFTDAEGYDGVAFGEIEASPLRIQQATDRFYADPSMRVDHILYASPDTDLSNLRA